MHNLHVVIMAGGEGNRFYPLSTPEHPKQFLNLIGDKSFIRQTFERILPLVSAENVYVSTSEKYALLVKEHLPEVPTENIITEPLKKNTAPALAYATTFIKKRHGDVLICCLPSDHYIKDENEFRKVVLLAASLAADDYLITFGMKPTRPSTDYGYICGENPNAEWTAVKCFTEKPQQSLAEQYINEGYLWNSGVFVWKASTFMTELQKHAPDICPEVYGDSPMAYFSSVSAKSIDYALMERSDKIVVIPADIGWSDVGSWQSIEQLHGEGVQVASHVLSVMKGSEEHPWRRIIPKPWGHEEWWAHTDRYVGKILFVKKGHRLSLQYHNIKDETLRLLSGSLELELAEGQKLVMRPGDVQRITPKTLHRMNAMSDCLVLEVSTPEVEDVVRVNDDYGR